MKGAGWCKRKGKGKRGRDTGDGSWEVDGRCGSRAKQSHPEDALMEGCLPRRKA